MKTIIVILALIAAALLYVRYRKPGAALAVPVTETVQKASKAARDSAMALEQKAHDLIPGGGQAPAAETSNPRLVGSPLERIIAREQINEESITPLANPSQALGERSVYDRILAGESLKESSLARTLPRTPPKNLSTYEQILRGARITEVTTN